ncbi:MAG: DNA-binding protein [Frankiales bacterium]|nr:DNA-binding protein [Frankiales bacterium]
MLGLLTATVRATASAADPDVVLDRVARVLLDAADWVLADRLDEPDLVTRVAAVTREGGLPVPLPAGPPQRRSAAGRIGLLPALLASPQRLLRLTADDLIGLLDSPDRHAAGQARSALELGTVELLLVVAVARDTPQAVLVLGSRTGFGEEVAAEVVDVASHVGLALDAGRLLAAQRAVATALQTSLLPPVPTVPGRTLAARYLPAAHELEVGGDWYDAFPTPAGLLLVVGDVRGHDLAAAAQMADLRNLLRAHAIDRDEPPSALLARLGRTTAALGLDISATCVAGCLAADGTFTWSSAGHLPPLLLRDGAAVLLETEAELMLGIDPATHRTDHVRVLQPGDTLVLFTDGLVEVRDRGLDERLQDLVQAAAAAGDVPPDLLAETLLALAEGSPDDVALLVVRLLA